MMPKNNSRPITTSTSRSRVGQVFQSVVQRVHRIFNAKSIETPVVNPDLAELPAIERAAEVVRYSVLRLEYWLSPGGILREVLRLCLMLALLIGLPTLIVGPVLLLLLEGAAAASASLASIAANLAALSISLITAVIGFAVLIALLRTLLRRK